MFRRIEKSGENFFKIFSKKVKKSIDNFLSVCYNTYVRWKQEDLTRKDEKTMKREKARKLMLELARRIHIKEHGTLEGFGKIAKFYRANWMPNSKITGGYKAAWDSKIMCELREIIGM